MEKLNKICTDAFLEMALNGIEKHISYIGPEDLEGSGFGLKSGGKIPKVTIEWVNSNEAGGCICGSMDDHLSVECYTGQKDSAQAA